MANFPTKVNSLGKSKVQQTAKEYSRGIIGGLLFSLPLLYTMEVWWTGFIAFPEKLVGCIIFTFLLLLGYNKHVGVREDQSTADLFRESVEEIGLAFVISFLFLLLIHKVGFSMSFSEIAGKVIVESMIVAIGISIGTEQLGQEDKVDRKKKKENTIAQMLVLALCGAVLVSSSVAPTEEILKIAIVSTPIHLLLMVLISLALCTLILGYIDFKNTTHEEADIKRTWTFVIISYLAALVVSFIMLWFFDRVDGYSLEIIVAQVIVLAVPAALGASAGRLIIGR